jgi:hypothetical protein
MSTAGPRKPANPAVIAGMSVATVVALGVIIFNSMQLLSFSSAPAKAPPTAPVSPPPPAAAQPEPAGSRESNPGKSPTREASAPAEVDDALLDGDANPFAPLPGGKSADPARVVGSDSAVEIPAPSGPRGGIRALPMGVISAPADPAVSRSVAPAEVEPEDLPVLLGTLHGHQDMALVRAGGETFLIGRGECVGNWDVENIVPGRVLLRQGKRTVVLRESSGNGTGSAKGN